MLWLSNEDIAELIGVDDVLEVLRSLYREIGEGISVHTGRTDLHHPLFVGGGDAEDDREGVIGRAHYLKTMTGGFVGGETAAIRLSSDIVRFTSDDSGLRREKEPLGRGKWLGLVALFSLATGDLIAVMQDGYIQRLRVGATNAIADDYLARSDAGDIAVLGSGAQARAHLNAIHCVRNIQRLRVWSPTLAHRIAFAEEMEDTLQVEAVPVDAPELAVQKCDILMTATNARRPFVEASWLSPGMHVSTLHRDELGASAYSKIERMVVHHHLMEQNASSTLLPRWKGQLLRDHPEPQDIQWDNFPTLGDLVVGRASGRVDDEEITGFVNNIGSGAQFAAVGSIVFLRARAQGVGIEIDGDRILESLHP